MYFELKYQREFYNTKSYIILLTITLLNLSCKKLVETDPPTTAITGRNVFLTNGTAIAVLTGIYSNMSGASLVSGELTSIGFVTGLSGDELTLYPGIDDVRLNYYKNLLSAESNISPWNIIYPKIHTCNSVIEGITNNQALNNKVKQQLLGEAEFIRAFCYFYLINLYGDVPLVTSSKYSVNYTLPRSNKDQVWQQIISDLKDAQVNLSNNFLDITLLQNTLERVRPTKWAATTLLARTYLFIKDWKNAELESSKVIANSELFHLEELNDVFKNTSSEAIWQLQPVNFGVNTEDARTYIINDFGPSGSGGVYISNQLFASFTADDERKKNWIGTTTYEGLDYHYAYKYKLTTGDVVNEYHTIFRLAELYLIRAESLGEQGRLPDAINDLDIIRNRAGLSLIKNTNPQIDVSGFRSAISEERNHELFTEWGHRWLDLKRTNAIDKVMSKVVMLKGTNWNSNWQLYPIPNYDILNDRNIIQNPGY